MTLHGFSLVCPRCRTLLEPAGEDGLRCPRDGRRFARRAGIWRFLDDDERPGFLERYAATRRAEGWGSEDPAYFRALPFEDLSGRHAAVWRVRARGFEAVMRRAVAPLARRRGRPLAVLDLGAGNGWLAYRLSRNGHRVAAVDVKTDAADGLGAWVHYPRRDGAPPFLPVAASFDRLPLVPASVDCAIWNGAFHYSADYTATLAEALRVLRPGGRLVILDTPIYRRRESGERMVAEREARLAERAGKPSGGATAETDLAGGGLAAGGPGADGLAAHEGFLTYDRLDRLGRELGIRWRLLRPFYGWRWHLRPLQARLLGRREPMRFRPVIGRAVGGDP